MVRPTTSTPAPTCPFYNDLDSNAVALYDESGNLLDFVAIGEHIVGLPAGASVTLISWPSSYDYTTQSSQRVAQSGKCPTFEGGDWAAKPLAHPGS